MTYRQAVAAGILAFAVAPAGHAAGSAGLRHADPQQLEVEDLRALAARLALGEGETLLHTTAAGLRIAVQVEGGVLRRWRVTGAAGGSVETLARELEIAGQRACWACARAPSGTIQCWRVDCPEQAAPVVDRTAPRTARQLLAQVEPEQHLVADVRPILAGMRLYAGSNLVHETDEELRLYARSKRQVVLAWTATLGGRRRLVGASRRTGPDACWHCAASPAGELYCWRVGCPPGDASGETRE